MITLAELRHVVPTTPVAVLEKYVEPLNDAMREFDIDTPVREAMLLAQILHESGGLHYAKELATGRDYEGRYDLGNMFPGDGVKFKGRGLIQITGRTNYILCSRALFGDDRLAITPELLEQPVFAVRSAAWFWKDHGCNELADKNDFKSITKRINGAATSGPPSHYDRRLALLARAQNVMGSDGVATA